MAVPKKRPGFMNQTDFAAHVGVRREMIVRLVRRGKIPTARDGSIPIEKGLAAWAVHAGVEVAPPAAKRGKKSGAAVLPADDEPAPTGTSSITDLAVNSKQAQLRERKAKIALLELDLAKKRGEVVPLDEIRADAAATCAGIRTRLLSLGPRVALALEALCARPTTGPRAPAIQAVIDDEINVILTGLHSSRFVDAAPTEKR